MNLRRRIFSQSVLLAAYLIGCASGLRAAPVRVYAEPATVNLPTGSSVLIHIYADVPDAILGWGLDLGFDPSFVALASVTIGPLWQSALSADGDDLAGLAFPDALSGNGLLLATVDFLAVAPGVTSIDVSFTPDDLAEGFPLLTGEFAEAAFESGIIQVSEVTDVPEPSGALSVTIGLTLIWFKFCRQRL